MAYLPHGRTVSSGSSSLLPERKPVQQPAQSHSNASTDASAGDRTGTHRPLLLLDTRESKRSWLQRQLKTRTKGDRAFFTLVRNKRDQPSRLTQRLKMQRPRYRLWQRLVVLTAVCATLGSATWTHLFLKEQVTLAGVPYRIIDKFWSDRSARDAYFMGDKYALHDRLKELGIESDIKDYYRDQFTNEHELDKHIHQIMFERTGYVGEAYRVNNMGELISISY